MKTILDGSKQLLLDVSDIVGSRKDILFVGGWGPYLRNTRLHPGTLDVDLLFPQEHTKEQMEEIAKLFLSNDFHVSAKHSFQLLRNYKIENNLYCYNLDFLHPTLEKTLITSFRDILDFDITIDGSKVKRLNSVCMPYGDILFNPGMNEVAQLDGRNIHVLSPAGTVFSKMQSCSNGKRPRDIFDILLSCREDPNLWSILETFVAADNRVSEIVESYKLIIDEKWDFFCKCLDQFNISADYAVKRTLLGEGNKKF